MRARPIWHRSLGVYVSGQGGRNAIPDSSTHKGGVIPQQVDQGGGILPTYVATSDHLLQNLMNTTQSELDKNGRVPVTHDLEIV